MKHLPKKLTSRTVDLAWQGVRYRRALGVSIQDVRVVCDISIYFLVHVFHEKVKEIAE